MFMFINMDKFIFFFMCDMKLKKKNNKWARRRRMILIC